MAISPEEAEAKVAYLEGKMIAAGVARERWLYISANADYTAETPEDHRLGGFSCDRHWLVKDCMKCPHLFHTVIDGTNWPRVLHYVEATTYWDEATGACIEGVEGICKLVNRTL